MQVVIFVSLFIFNKNNIIFPKHVLHLLRMLFKNMSIVYRWFLQKHKQTLCGC